MPKWSFSCFSKSSAVVADCVQKELIVWQRQYWFHVLEDPLPTVNHAQWSACCFLLPTHLPSPFVSNPLCYPLWKAEMNDISDGTHKWTTTAKKRNYGPVGSFLVISLGYGKVLYNTNTQWLSTWGLFLEGEKAIVPLAISIVLGMPEAVLWIPTIIFLMNFSNCLYYVIWAKLMGMLCCCLSDSRCACFTYALMKCLFFDTQWPWLHGQRSAAARVAWNGPLQDGALGSIPVLCPPSGATWRRLPDGRWLLQWAGAILPNPLQRGSST